MYLEGQSVLVDLRRLIGTDHRFPVEGLPLVAQHQLSVLDLAEAGAPFRAVVLDVEQVGEVAGGVDPYPQVDGVLGVVDDGDVLDEAVAHGAVTHHGQLSVDVHCRGPRHAEEPGLEVLQIINGQRAEPGAVHGQHPRRQKPGVEREQTGGIRRGGFDVAGLVTDDERVAIQKLDRGAVHPDRLRPLHTVGGPLWPGGPGSSRLNWTTRP
jgi:hypothetical protein